MSPRRHRPPVAPGRAVLDSGGLSALTGRSTRARAWLRWIAEHGGTVVVPAVVLVESTTGDAGGDAETNRVVRALLPPRSEPVPADAAVARAAGGLRHRAGVDDGIDALVAAEAARQGRCILLTSDPDDLRALLADTPGVEVRGV